MGERPQRGRPPPRPRSPAPSTPETPPPDQEGKGPRSPFRPLRRGQRSSTRLSLLPRPGPAHRFRTGRGRGQDRRQSARQTQRHALVRSRCPGPARLSCPCALRSGLPPTLLGHPSSGRSAPQHHAPRIRQGRLTPQKRDAPSTNGATPTTKRPHTRSQLSLPLLARACM